MRAVILAVLFICFRVSAIAQPSADELRNLAYDGNFEAIEAALAEAHQQSLGGDISFDDLRRMVVALTVTHPTILETTEAWLEALPDSPYANALRAFQYRHFAWAIRGGGTARETHPEVLQTFASYMSAGMEHALVAYDAAPDYAPAVDAVLRQQVQTKRLSRRDFFELVEHAMVTVPSLGTLSRAARSAHPGWGGRGMEDIVFFCEEFAAQVEDTDGYTKEICIADQAYRIWSLGAEQRQWAWEQLGEQYHPRLRFATLRRVAFYPYADAPANHIDKLIAYFEADGRSDHEAVKDLLRRTPPEGSLGAVMQQAGNRGWEKLTQNLPHDPFNRNYLTTLTSHSPQFSNFSVDPTRFEFDPARSLKQESRYIAHLRFAYLEPHNHHHWAFAAAARRAVGGPDAEADADRLFANAIYYAEHDRASIAWAIGDKWRSFQRATNHELGMPANAEHAKQWLCPMIRLDRLLNLRCEADGDAGAACMERAEILYRYDLTLQDARQNGMCADESTGTLAQLSYTAPSYMLEVDELLTPLEFKESWQDP